MRAWAWLGLAAARGFAAAEEAKSCLGKALASAETAEAEALLRRLDARIPRPGGG